MFKGFVREGELRRWAPWAGMGALILLAVALGTGMESVCWDEEVAKATKVNEAPGCFEFWFNRYQTLVGAIAALAAAGTAWAGVRRQIDKADEQIAVASRQSAIAMLPVLDQRTESAIKVYRSAMTLENIGFDMLRSSQESFIRARVLHRAYVAGEDIRRSIAVLKDNLKEYDSRVGVFSKAMSDFGDELSRGFGGPALREAGQKIWAGAVDLLKMHREAIERLETFGANQFRDNKEVDARFADVSRYDRIKFAIPDYAYAIPMEIIAKEVVLLQDERDRVFERSRS